ncbi:hypothetical protein [Motilibacter deserti]|uniref:LPXTG-motif cell wall-anchored protein n=1 Tax=Motilibacter deserti TaxID=2714956 RepID=A0ABX0GRS2_9ACTN|nr:hypothetical protein [Motilibacter deserti]NHC12549.1 hypothetical protein [Motilibacter deserti]
MGAWVVPAISVTVLDASSAAAASPGPFTPEQPLPSSTPTPSQTPQPSPTDTVPPEVVPSDTVTPEPEPTSLEPSDSPTSSPTSEALPDTLPRTGASIVPAGALGLGAVATGVALRMAASRAGRSGGADPEPPAAT